MGTTNGKESCGRCGFSTIVDAVEDEDDERERYDPFEGGHIEVDERELRLASAPTLALGRLKRRLDGGAHRLIHGRR